RNAPDIQSRGQIREALRIDLEHDGATRQVAGHMLHMRRSHPARTAPRRPKINQHRNPAFTYDFIKFSRTDLKRLSHRRQWSLAPAASSSVGEMLSRNSIGLSTGQAISNDRHCTLLANNSANIIAGK